MCCFQAAIGSDLASSNKPRKQRLCCNIQRHCEGIKTVAPHRKPWPRPREKRERESPTDGEIKATEMKCPVLQISPVECGHPRRAWRRQRCCSVPGRCPQPSRLLNPPFNSRHRRERLCAPAEEGARRPSKAALPPEGPCAGFDRRPPV